MGELDDILGRDEIPQVISELERLGGPGRRQTVAAIHILKNELAPLAGGGPRRRLLFDRRFLLPEQERSPLAAWLTRWRRDGAVAALATTARGLAASLGGRGAEHFRDLCDRRFWERVVPVVEERFGAVADPLLNTVNEAIINYAEYSFAPFSPGKRIAVHLFLTEEELGYAIVRPLGGRVRPFDPRTLRIKRTRVLGEMKRGWGHTLLMERALFISFDREPRRRGLMIVVGPEGG